MRPKLLNPLFAPVTVLDRVGPRIGRTLGQLAGPRAVDLLWHLLTGVVDRRFSPKIADAPAGIVATLTVTVRAHWPPSHERQPYKVVCADDTGEMVLVFFRARAAALLSLLPPGETRVISGRIEHYAGVVQMSHPDHIAPPADAARLARVEPVYPLTAGITAPPLARTISGALERAPDLPEWNDSAHTAREGWPAWRDALHRIHHPQSAADLAPDAPHRRRLAYDELLANQLALALVRAHMRRTGGRSLRGAQARRIMPRAAGRKSGGRGGPPLDPRCPGARKTAAKGPDSPAGMRGGRGRVNRNARPAVQWGTDRT